MFSRAKVVDVSPGDTKNVRWGMADTMCQVRIGKNEMSGKVWYQARTEASEVVRTSTATQPTLQRKHGMVAADSSGRRRHASGPCTTWHLRHRFLDDC